MQNLFIEFIQSPSQDKFLSLRQKIIQDQSYQPYSEDLNQIEDLLAQEQFKAAETLLESGMPNLLLSPRAHLLMAFIIEKLHQDEDWSFTEQHIANLCVENILETGDGSEEKPYLVTRLTDEYDVLHYLGLEMKTQKLIEKNQQYYDVLTTTDEKTFWFNINDIYQHTPFSL